MAQLANNEGLEISIQNFENRTSNNESDSTLQIDEKTEPQISGENSDEILLYVDENTPSNVQNIIRAALIQQQQQHSDTVSDINNEVPCTDFQTINDNSSLMQVENGDNQLILQPENITAANMEALTGALISTTNTNSSTDNPVSYFKVSTATTLGEVESTYTPGDFNVGDAFYSLEELEEALKRYEEKHEVKLYKRDVRSLEALLKRSLKLQKLSHINAKLKYGQLLYCCVFGGKRRSQKIACMDDSGVARFTDCKMFVRFGISNDGMKLLVLAKSEEHCHDEIVSDNILLYEPVTVLNEGNAKDLHLGAGFVDLEELYKAVYKYEAEHHIHLWRRDGRTVEALAKRAPGTARKIMEANPGLRFAELRFCCSHGGKNSFDYKKDDLKFGSSLRQGCEMHIRFGISEDGSQLIVKSMSEEHNHEINEETIVKEALHPELCSYISKLVWNDSHVNAEDVKMKLENYVINVMFKNQTTPPRTRRQYFPTKKQIRYFMGKARSCLNISEESETKLEAHVEKLKETHKDDKMIFNFRVKSKINMDENPSNLEDDLMLEKTLDETPASDVIHDESARILFCHQTPHQQRILKRYNSQIILTQVNDFYSKIPFPLYTLFVQTNVDYQLVGEFILQKNDKTMVAEALNIIKEWNPGWLPKFVVTDFSEEQINAVETAFPGSFIMISDSSREKAWDDWLDTPSNGLKSYKEEILKHLRAIANSFSEDTLNTSARNLEESDIWKMSDHFRNWFQMSWLAHAKRWVTGYRPDDYLDLYHQGRTLQDEMKGFKGIKITNKTNPLQDVIQHIVEHVVPLSKRQYETFNRESSRLQNELYYTYNDMPEFLTSRPGLLSHHIYERICLAKSQNLTITYLHPGIFSVLENFDENSVTHMISFGDVNTYPSCDCADWLHYKLPCVHFAAVFNTYTEWNWDMLCTHYKSNPAFTVDLSVLKNDIQITPKTRIDQSTQAGDCNSNLSNVSSSSSKVNLPEIKRFPESQQMLANHCRTLLVQLSKLQLAQQSKEKLLRLRSDLKDLISIFTKTKSSSNSSTLTTTQSKLSTSINKQSKLSTLNVSAGKVFEQFHVKPVNSKQEVTAGQTIIINQEHEDDDCDDEDEKDLSDQFILVESTTLTEENEEDSLIKVSRKRVIDVPNESYIPEKRRTLIDDNEVSSDNVDSSVDLTKRGIPNDLIINDASNEVSSSIDFPPNKENEMKHGDVNEEDSIKILLAQFPDSENFQGTPVPIILDNTDLTKIISVNNANKDFNIENHINDDEESSADTAVK